jgi:hypothetical protein
MYIKHVPANKRPESVKLTLMSPKVEELPDLNSSLEDLIDGFIMESISYDGIMLSVSEGDVDAKKGTCFELLLTHFLAKEIQLFFQKVVEECDVYGLIKYLDLKQVTKKNWKTKAYTPYIPKTSKLGEWSVFLR